MPFNATTYHAKDTPIHALDARVKIALVLVFSIALFLVHTWKGLALLALLVGLMAALARLDVSRTARQLLPLGLILMVTLLANTFVLDVNAPIHGLGVGSAGIFADAKAIPLIGSFGISTPGLVRGCFYVVRIVLLVAASLVLTTTTTSTQLADALSSILAPLSRVGFPVHDAATIVSIAMRFIPVSINQFQQVRQAQASRGALFNTGSLKKRFHAWSTVLIPLFVGLYRRADDLAAAMDARAYGMAAATRLDDVRVSARGWLVCAVGCALCAGIAWLF